MNRSLRFVSCWLFVCAAAFADGRVGENRRHGELTFEGDLLPDRSGGPAEVGLYIGKGTWPAGKEHLKLYLQDRGFPYRTFTAKEVLSGELTSSGIKVVIFPGGASWEYLKELGEDGAKRVRAFVDAGGGYAGICAGAFYATSERLGGYATGLYGIGLLEGTAHDGTALKVPAFVDGMMDFDILGGAGLLKGLPQTMRIVLLGGPSFRYSPKEEAAKGIEVLARFPKIDEPAMIAFRYGKGRVYLSGPHLEIEEPLTDWGADFDDPESDWPILDRVFPYLEGKRSVAGLGR
jgi:glutamine amidotransferase-like uncharacterized protein